MGREERYDEFEGEPKTVDTGMTTGSTTQDTTDTTSTTTADTTTTGDHGSASMTDNINHKKEETDKI